MNCSKFESRLTDYMDHTIDLRLHDAMSEHARDCLSCSNLVMEIQGLRRSLAEFPLIPVPPGLVERILDQTTGRPQSRSLWRDMVVPTVKPFLTRRYAFGTGIMLLFISVVINMLGPDFSTMGYSNLTPSGMVENADRLTDQLKKKWSQVKIYQAKAVEEAKLIREDLYGRLDYYLINLLFKSYSQSVEKEEQQPQTKDNKQPAPAPTKGK